MTGLKVGSEIGRGSFASVFKGEYDGKPVAVKSVLRAKLSKKLLENLESEIRILKDLRHPHIVEFLDYQQTSSHFHLIMEYCSLGDLSFFIRKREQISNSLPLVASLFERYPSSDGMHEDLVRHFLKQLASALAFLRSKNLVHRDIKPQNLLLCPPKKYRSDAEAAGYAGQWELPVLKLADFGFARILPSTSLAETLCGSPLYMAPEILRYEKYGAKADLWSVGAVLYEMVVGKPPFKAINHVELLKKIERTKDRIEFSDKVVERTSDDIRRLVKALLKQAPTERMSYTEFFQDIVLKDDISAKNTPLDRSRLDEKMFISEYIQPKARTLTSNTNGNTTAPLRLKQESLILPEESESSTLETRPVELASVDAAVEVAVRTVAGSATRLASGKQTTPPEHSLEHEYVVVEKRTVEVNALADELARSPTDRRDRSPIRIIDQRRRRSSIVYGTSPTSALARALSMASARLFGIKVDTFGNTITTSPSLSQHNGTAGGSNNALILSSNGASTFASGVIPSNITEEERKVIKDLESLATKAKVVNLFAEVKFSQLVPSSPDADLALDREMIIVVSEEALVLYVKTLALLANAMESAAGWWRENEMAGASSRLNDTVQWIRDRFNECLERAEYSQQLLEDARSHQNSGSTATGSSSTSSHATAKQPVTAEKLIFDRALEMSRSAAVNELTSTSAADLEGCELSYGTAVWMLEALLETGGEGQEGLDEDDRTVVEKFIASITHRLYVLRRKLEVERGLSSGSSTKSRSQSQSRSREASRERVV